MMWSGMTLEPPSERWLTGEPAASRTLRKSPLITTASLKSYSTKDLAQLAKRQGVAGWHSMNKVQLVRALGRVAKPKAAVRKKSALKSALKTAKHGNGHRLVSRASATRATVSRPSSNGHKANGDAKANGHPNPNGQAKSNGEAKRPARKKAKNLFVAKRIQRAHENQERRKDLSGMLYTGPDVPKNGKARPEAIRDRVVLLVRDPFWLQACWEVTRQSVLRAQAAMAEHWHTARGPIPLDHPIILGVLNVTPDSFSDGGKFTGVDAALAHAAHLVESGADIVDVGGESTRPGAVPVSADEEIVRVVPVVKALVREFPAARGKIAALTR